MLGWVKRDEKWGKYSFYLYFPRRESKVVWKRWKKDFLFIFSSIFHIAMGPP
jgi:hypothetical protein